MMNRENMNYNDSFEGLGSMITTGMHAGADFGFPGSHSDAQRISESMISSKKSTPKLSGLWNFFGRKTND